MPKSVLCSNTDSCTFRDIFTDSTISNNKVAGVRHDPVINAKQQKEIAGWFKMASSDYTVVVTYSPQFLPRLDERTVIDFSTDGETKHFITERIHGAQAINKTYILKVSRTVFLCL